ncbi:hypothetical protein [Dethiothermospora halolimnae]|uniref:hypothetical protein n=1 Tax=Dethiothermospora halolimnae TaxID=3114390 RepID=UPI003CCB9195
MDYEMPKHHYNLTKAVEGTGWVLCDTLNTMVRNNIRINDNSKDSLLAENINELFQVIAECEEPDIINHLADKITEYAGNDINKFINYMGENMGDNPLYKRVVEINEKDL